MGHVYSLILLAFIISSVFPTWTKVKPMFENRFPVTMSNDRTLPVNDERYYSRMPTINVNIIVVPINREPLVETGELANYNSKRLSSQRKILEFPVTTSSSRMVNRFMPDLDAMASSNEFNEIYFPDRTQDPAQGIISPQQEHKCKDSEVYDKGLGQCIKLVKDRACPLCSRRGGRSY